MGRRPCLEDDSYRLPDGFVRVGYDADTQSYIYQDSRGVSWEGGPGNRYGSLRPTLNHSCTRLSPITQRAGETIPRPSPSRPIDALHPPSPPIVRPTPQRRPIIQPPPQRHPSHQIVWVPPTFGGLNRSERRPADSGEYDKSVSRRRGFLARVFRGSDLEEKSSRGTREAEDIPLRRGRVYTTTIETVLRPKKK